MSVGNRGVRLPLFLFRSPLLSCSVGRSSRSVAAGVLFSLSCLVLSCLCLCLFFAAVAGPLLKNRDMAAATLTIPFLDRLLYRFDPVRLVRSGGVAVTLHGLWGNPLQFTMLHRLLEAPPYQFGIVSHSYSPTRKSTSEHAADLWDLIQRVYDSVEPNVPVHFVAHSYAGAVLRRCLSGGSFLREHTRVALLAPVQRGATIARKFNAFSFVLGAPNGGGREMVNMLPDDFEAMLGCWPDRLPILNVLSDAGRLSNPLLARPNDGTLTWQDSYITQLGSAEQRKFITEVHVKATHATMLWNAEVIRLVADFLFAGSNEPCMPGGSPLSRQ